MVLPDPDELARVLADRIVHVIRSRSSAGAGCVLGLAAGSTPLGIYRELVRRHRAGEVDFARVVTFSLDEYWPAAPDDPRSFGRQMRDNLIDHLNIPSCRAHAPDGSAPRERVEEVCAAYEAAIRAAGGIDFQLLGIGRNGHIGFNEPGSPADSRTRLVTLDPVTRRDAASKFSGEDEVPRMAITIGVATILEAREIALAATGGHKAAIVQRAVEGEPCPEVVASYLQHHPGATVYLDRAAASRLGRFTAPASGES